jgi:hypothetical protein
MSREFIPTDMRLFGFPVVLDWRMDRNVIELRNPRGDRIRIEIQPEPAALPPPPEAPEQ